MKEIREMEKAFLGQIILETPYDFYLHKDEEEEEEKEKEEANFFVCMNTY